MYYKRLFEEHIVVLTKGGNNMCIGYQCDDEFPERAPERGRPFQRVRRVRRAVGIIRNEDAPSHSSSGSSSSSNRSSSRTSSQQALQGAPVPEQALVEVVAHPSGDAGGAQRQASASVGVGHQREAASQAGATNHDRRGEWFLWHSNRFTKIKKARKWIGWQVVCARHTDPAEGQGAKCSRSRKFRVDCECPDEPAFLAENELTLSMLKNWIVRRVNPDSKRYHMALAQSGPSDFLPVLDLEQRARLLQLGDAAVDAPAVSASSASSAPVERALHGEDGPARAGRAASSHEMGANASHKRQASNSPLDEASSSSNEDSASNDDSSSDSESD